MRRREVISLVGAAALLPSVVRAEQSGVRTARVGVLSPFLSSGAPAPSYDSFSQTLRELGWVEGRNITFEYRWAEGRADQLPRLAAELAGLKVDLIYSAWGTPAALAAKAASKTIPIVFTGVGDAIGVGRVQSSAESGRTSDAHEVQHPGTCADAYSADGERDPSSEWGQLFQKYNQCQQRNPKYVHHPAHKQ